MLTRLRYGRHRPFYLSVTFAIITLVVSLLIWPAITIALSANVFFLTYLCTALRHLPHMSPQFLQKNALNEDIPVWIIFLVVLATIITAIATMFILINQEHTAHWLELVIAIAAVPLGWASIHMIAAQHYAHIYWQPQSTEIADNHSGHVPPVGGIEFPRTAQPCGMDFVYFSYVIGMTAQTSDTSITTTAMRSVNLIHSIISFFFNAALLAAAVNIVVAL